MSQNKKIRFSDRADLLLQGRTDFITRKRTKMQQIYVIFAMVIVIIIGVTVLLYSQALLASQICVIVGSVLYDIGRKFEKLQKQLLASEFMNAMFSSAVGIHYKFAMVAKPDGEIIYFDRGAQHMFPDCAEQPKQTLAGLFDTYQLDSANRQKVISSVGQGFQENLNVFIATGLDKAMTPIHLTVDPIPRPSGFLLIRGKTAS